MSIERLEERERTFSPADMMTLFSIPVGTWDAWKARGILAHEVKRRSSGGKVSRTSIIEACQVGIHLALVQDVGLSHQDAREFAKAAGVEIEKLFLGPPPRVGQEANMPFIIITGAKPEWFRVTLDTELSKIHERVANRPAVIFDLWPILEKVTDAMAAKDPDYEPWLKRELAKRN